MCIPVDNCCFAAVQCRAQKAFKLQLLVLGNLSLYFDQIEKVQRGVTANGKLQTLDKELASGAVSLAVLTRPPPETKTTPTCPPP